MKKASRTQQQVAFDGVQTIWSSATQVAHPAIERISRRSIDGVVFSGVYDLAMQIHRNDLHQATAKRREILIARNTLTNLISSIDGIRRSTTVVT